MQLSVDRSGAEYRRLWQLTRDLGSRAARGDQAAFEHLLCCVLLANEVERNSWTPEPAPTGPVTRLRHAHESRTPAPAPTSATVRTIVRDDKGLAVASIEEHGTFTFTPAVGR